MCWLKLSIRAEFSLKQRWSRVKLQQEELELGTLGANSGAGEQHRTSPLWGYRMLSPEQATLLHLIRNEMFSCCQVAQTSVVSCKIELL